MILLGHVWRGCCTIYLLWSLSVESKTMQGLVQIHIYTNIYSYLQYAYMHAHIHMYVYICMCIHRPCTHTRIHTHYINRVWKLWFRDTIFAHTVACFTSLCFVFLQIDPMRTRFILHMQGGLYHRRNYESWSFYKAAGSCASPFQIWIWREGPLLWNVNRYFWGRCSSIFWEVLIFTFQDLFAL